MTTSSPTTRPAPGSPWRPGPRLLAALALGLALLGAVYGVRATVLLAGGSSGGYDFQVRWITGQYVLRGQNPYDVMSAMPEHAGRVPGPKGTHPTAIAPDLGEPHWVLDPPWAFAWYAPLFGLPLPAGRVAFAGLCVLALGGIAAWARAVGRASGARAGLLLGAAALAVSNAGSTIVFGQTGLFVVAAMVGALAAFERRRPILAGLALAAAISKPTVAGTLVLALLLRPGGWRPVLVAALATGAVSILVGGWVGTDPLSMGVQWLMSARDIHGTGYGPSAVLHAFGWAGFPSIAALALAGCALVVGAHRCLRGAGALDLAGVAAVAGRLWSYHNLYDNVMLVVTLVALGHRALAWGGRGRWASFLLLGLSLWIPPRFMDLLGVQLAQHAVWIGAVVVLLRDARRCPAPGLGRSHP